MENIVEIDSTQGYIQMQPVIPEMVTKRVVDIANISRCTDVRDDQWEDGAGVEHKSTAEATKKMLIYAQKMLI